MIVGLAAANVIIVYGCRRWTNATIIIESMAWPFILNVIKEIGKILHDSRRLAMTTFDCNSS